MGQTHKYSVGEKFILRRSRLGHRGIDRSDFGKTVEIELVIEDPRAEMPEYRLSLGDCQIRWYVWEDMLEPVAGPW